MDNTNKSNTSLSYSTLFNIEPLTNFQLPQQDDEFDYYGNSSQDEESRDSRGGAISNHTNGNVHSMDVNLLKKRVRSQNSDDEGKGGFYGTYMTEERYRSMLGDHVQKCKRRSKESSSPAQNCAVVPHMKSNNEFKTQKLANDHQGGLHAADTLSGWLYNSNSQKHGNYRNADFVQRNVTDRVMYEPSILEIGDGVTYKIPPVYDKLATSLNLLSFSDIHVDEFYLKGTWDLGLLAAMMASDKRLGNLNRAGMGEHLSQYESLQARIKAMSASNLPQKFSLNVSDIGLNSSIPEGAAGSIKRSILSEGGVLQVYYVKVLEKVTLTRSLSKAYPRSKR